MREFYEFQQMQQLLGSGRAWLQVAFFLGLMWAMLYRPERIRLPGLFRWACVLFALSVCVGPALLGLWTVIESLENTPMGSRRGSSDLWNIVIPIVNASGPILLGISMVFALLAVCPPMKPVYRQREAPPVQRPPE